MNQDETIGALWAQAEQTSIWAYLEAEKVRSIYYKYLVGDRPIDPRDLSIIAKSHEELLLRISAAEIFRTQMIVDLIKAKGVP